MTEILDPELPIVDTHHHLWRRPGSVYDIDDYLGDLAGGHRILASVAVEAQTSDSSPTEEAALAETAHARAIGDRFSNADNPHPCAAIVAYADLTARTAAAALDRQVEAAAGRLRGIRQKAAWHSDPALHPRRLNPHHNLLGAPAFRQTFALLRRHSLLFEAWVYHPQLPGVCELARRFPDIGIVLEHAGTPLLALATNDQQRLETMRDWTAHLRALGRYPNVTIKISGLGMDCVTAHPGDEATPALWKQIVDTCLDAFGCSRCMFGSNFPVDRRVACFTELWNSYKRLTKLCSLDERKMLFEMNARRIYRI